MRVIKLRTIDVHNSIKKMDKSKKIEDVVEGLGKLPTLPVIAMRILEAVGIESLKRQVAQDSMTKLINHQHFNELLEQEISRSERYNRPLAIIIADIDHFKSINDTFGHPVGDYVIKTVADILRSELRESDHVARYGGDEFAVILPETPLDNALAAAEKLRETIESLKVVCDNKDIFVTMSFGVSAIPTTPKISRDELKKWADSALYEAKKQGRNRCCFFEIN